MRIEPIGSDNQVGSVRIELECSCGRHLELNSIDGGHPAFCPNCEKAYYLRSHRDHYHVRTEIMTREQILQETYGRILVHS